jgi:hypothetical protein
MPHCEACEERTHVRFNFRDRMLCRECYLELAFGQIPAIHAKICHPGSSGQWDDSDNPMLQNQIRAMEDNQGASE